MLLSWVYWEGVPPYCLGGLRPDGVMGGVGVALKFGCPPLPGITHVMNNMHNVRFGFTAGKFKIC